MMKKLILIFLFIPFILNGQIRSGVIASQGVVTVAPASISTPIAFWNFNEASGNVIDQVADYDGTVTGATQNVTGLLSKAISFDGSNDFVDFGTTVGDNGTNDFSINVWVNINTDLAAHRGICGNWGGAETQYIQLYINLGVVKANIAFNDVDHIVTTPALSINVWHHIVWVVDRDGLSRIWLDGASTEAAASLDISAHSAVVNSNTTMFAIGRIGADLTGYYWDGLVDEFGKFNQTLTEEEILLLYNSGNGRTFNGSTWN